MCSLLYVFPYHKLLETRVPKRFFAEAYGSIYNPFWKRRVLCKVKGSA
jgi:hypothetical protein